MYDCVSCGRMASKSKSDLGRATRRRPQQQQQSKRSLHCDSNERKQAIRDMTLAGVTRFSPEIDDCRQMQTFIRLPSRRLANKPKWLSFVGVSVGLVVAVCIAVEAARYSHETSSLFANTGRFKRQEEVTTTQSPSTLVASTEVPAEGSVSTSLGPAADTEAGAGVGAATTPSPSTLDETTTSTPSTTTTTTTTERPKVKIPAVNFTEVDELFSKTLDEQQVITKWRHMDKQILEGELHKPEPNAN